MECSTKKSSQLLDDDDDSNEEELYKLLNLIIQDLSIFIESTKESSEISFGRLISASKHVMKVIEQYNFIIDHNNGLEWDTLAKLAKYGSYFARETDSTPGQFFSNQKRSLIFQLGLLKIAATEISNIKTAFEYILKYPGYAVGEECICPKLNTLVDFMEDRLLLHRLCNALADLFNLDKLDEKLFRRRFNLTNVDERIHLTQSLVVIFEGIHQLSSFAKQFFPEELLQKGFKFRNIICHPERNDDKIDNYICKSKTSGLTANEMKYMDLFYYARNSHLIALCINYYCHYYTLIDENCTVSNNYSCSDEIVPLLLLVENIKIKLEEEDSAWSHFLTKMKDMLSSNTSFDDCVNLITQHCSNNISLPEPPSDLIIIKHFNNYYREADKLTMYDRYQIKKLRSLKSNLQSSSEYKLWCDKLPEIYNRIIYYKLLKKVNLTETDFNRLAELHTTFSHNKLGDNASQADHRRRDILTTFNEKKKNINSMSKKLSSNKEKYDSAKQLSQLNSIGSDDEKLINGYEILQRKYEVEPKNILEIYSDEINQINQNEEQDQQKKDNKYIKNTLEKIIFNLKSLIDIGLFTNQFITEIDGKLNFQYGSSILNYTKREFYFLQVGSLIRSLIDPKISIIKYQSFILELKNIKLSNNESLYHALEFIQKFRGTIAHMETIPAVGNHEDTFMMYRRVFQNYSNEKLLLEIIQKLCTISSNLKLI